MKKSAAISAGEKNGCHFCLAASKTAVKVGDRIKILNGFRAGLVGTIVEPPPGFPADMVLLQADGDPPEEQQSLIVSKNLFEILPTPKWPKWTPPIAIGEMQELDSIVVKFCDNSYYAGTWKPNWVYYYDVIRFIWEHRLPLEPNEVWQVLNAHGAPDNWKNRLTGLFKDGRDILIHVNGHKPIKKKLVERNLEDS